MHTPDRWSCTDQELRQVRRINKTLAWLPRFRIRNRVTPRVIQSLLKLRQLRSEATLRRQSMHAETRTVGFEGGTPVSVRILRHTGSGAAKPSAIILDFHGGGWVIGNAQMNDDLNIAIAKTCNAIVVSVDYRLAVSTPIEGLMDDCLLAARWLLSNPSEAFAGLPVIVVGESAGGHLAAATLARLQAWPSLLRRIQGAVLYYGVYDLSGTPSVRAAGADTLVLDGPGMVQAFRMLTPDASDEQRRQSPLSPLYGDCAGFPPALMFVGDIDPLRDDTLLMGQRWREAADAQVHLLAECPHGFIHLPSGVAGRVLAYSREWICDRINAR